MFSPHHRFNNCSRIERTMTQFRQAGKVPDDVFKGYNRYHFALVHKLKCAHNFFDQLYALGTTSPAEIIRDSVHFLFSVNSNIDGFFYTGGSALDILAREVLTYFNVSMPRDVYFKTAFAQLDHQRPNDPLLVRLQPPNWKDEFSNYRNALTHEVLIAGSYQINVDMEGATESTRIVFPLPDDPRVDPEARTSRRNSDVICYCQTTFRRLLSLINTIYGDLNDRFDTAGVLPI